MGSESKSLLVPGYVDRLEKPVSVSQGDSLSISLDHPDPSCKYRDEEPSLILFEPGFGGQFMSQVLYNPS